MCKWKTYDMEGWESLMIALTDHAIAGSTYRDRLEGPKNPVSVPAETLCEVCLYKRLL